MIKDSEVRSQLIAMLQQRTSLDAFEDWIVARSWNMHRDSSSSVQGLVAAVELALSEHSNHHISAAQLVTELAALAENVQVSVRFSLSGVEAYPVPFSAASQSFLRSASALVPALA